VKKRWAVLSAARLLGRRVRSGVDGHGEANRSMGFTSGMVRDRRAQRVIRDIADVLDEDDRAAREFAPGLFMARFG